MEPKPVKRNLIPHYPTRLEVLENRELLEKHMPSTWKSCAEIAGAATILLTINGCLGEHPNKAKAIVAPIFQHGEGRGTYGCEVVNPPVFLSEQDAMQVIGEELQRASVVWSDKKVKVPDVSIPQREGKRILGGILTLDVKTGAYKPLVLQSFDSKKKVAVSFVHLGNYFDLGGAESGSITDYDFRKVAKEVRDRVAGNGHDLYLGTFYDPTIPDEEAQQQDSDYNTRLSRIYGEIRSTTDPRLRKQKFDEIDKLREQHIEPLVQESHRLLRMQVKDFIDWLKGQGVI